MKEPTDRFDQADHLRAAALIRDELSDYRMHPWASCIDVCRDLTDGNRRDASDLAWTALTSVLDIECVWDGPRGLRRLAMCPPPAFTMGVPCPHPRCRAAVGEPCLQRNGIEKVWPHEQRETDAVAASECSPAAQRFVTQLTPAAH